MLLLLT